MELMIEVPDKTKAVFACYVYDDGDYLKMGVKPIGLYDIDNQKEYFEGFKFSTAIEGKANDGQRT